MLHLNVLRQLLHFSKRQFQEIINFHAHMDFSKYQIFWDLEKFISQLWKMKLYTSYSSLLFLT